LLERQRHLLDDRTKAAAAAALALLAFLVGWPGAATLAGQLGAVVVAALVVVVAIRRFVATRAAAAPEAPDERLLDPVADDYERLRRQVELAMQPEAGIDVFLARELREIASQLLLRYGVELERDHERARRLVGDEVWGVIRPGHRASSLGRADLGRVLDRLEAL